MKRLSFIGLFTSPRRSCPLAMEERHLKIRKVVRNQSEGSKSEKECWRVSPVLLRSIQIGLTTTHPR